MLRNQSSVSRKCKQCPLNRWKHDCMPDSILAALLPLIHYNNMNCVNTADVYHIKTLVENNLCAYFSLSYVQKTHNLSVFVTVSQCEFMCVLAIKMCQIGQPRVWASHKPSFFSPQHNKARQHRYELKDLAFIKGMHITHSDACCSFKLIASC